MVPKGQTYDNTQINNYEHISIFDGASETLHICIGISNQDPHVIVIDRENKRIDPKTFFHHHFNENIVPTQQLLPFPGTWEEIKIVHKNNDTIKLLKL